MDAGQYSGAFAYLHLPGATSRYNDLLEMGARKVADAQTNGIYKRLDAASTLLQLFIEVNVVAFGAIGHTFTSVPISLLSLNYQATLDLLSNNLTAIVHAVKMAVVIPFLLLAAITVAPESILVGLNTTNPLPEQRNRAQAEVEQRLRHTEERFTQQLRAVIEERNGLARRYNDTLAIGQAIERERNAFNAQYNGSIIREKELRERLSKQQLASEAADVLSARSTRTVASGGKPIVPPKSKKLDSIPVDRRGEQQPSASNFVNTTSMQVFLGASAKRPQPSVHDRPPTPARTLPTQQNVPTLSQRGSVLHQGSRDLAGSSQRQPQVLDPMVSSIRFDAEKDANKNRRDSPPTTLLSETGDWHSMPASSTAASETNRDSFGQEEEIPRLVSKLAEASFEEEIMPEPGKEVASFSENTFPAQLNRLQINSVQQQQQKGGVVEDLPPPPPPPLPPEEEGELDDLEGSANALAAEQLPRPPADGSGFKTTDI